MTRVNAIFTCVICNNKLIKSYKKNLDRLIFSQSGRSTKHQSLYDKAHKTQALKLTFITLGFEPAISLHVGFKFAQIVSLKPSLPVYPDSVFGEHVTFAKVVVY